MIAAPRWSWSRGQRRGARWLASTGRSWCSSPGCSSWSRACAAPACSTTPSPGFAAYGLATTLVSLAIGFGILAIERAIGYAGWLGI